MIMRIEKKSMSLWEAFKGYGWFLLIIALYLTYKNYASLGDYGFETKLTILLGIWPFFLLIFIIYWKLKNWKIILGKKK